MKNCQKNWFIAIKKVEAISDALKKQLISMDVEVLEGDCYIHCHFFIPESIYAHAESIFEGFGFELTDEHPPICQIGNKEGFEIYEKRVPFIEVREAKALAGLAENGVCMSGGAGKPHVHLKIPEAIHQTVAQLLQENGYCLKNYTD